MDEMCGKIREELRPRPDNPENCDDIYVLFEESSSSTISSNNHGRMIFFSIYASISHQKVPVDMGC